MPMNPRSIPGTALRLSETVDCDVSVVIVSYNTREITLECVRSVLEHAGDLAVEVIVVDNQSTDGSSAALRAAYDGITVIDSPINGGFAYGNAIGFERAHGRYVLMLNPDAQLHAGSLQDSIAFMEAHPKVGIMGPRVRLEDGSQQSSMIRFLTLTQLFFLIFVPNKLMRRTAWFGDPRYARLSRDTVNSVDAVAGCFMLIRRGLLEQIGGLDTRFFMYSEETEWCWRAREAGWDIVYNPQVEILHFGAASTAHMSEWKAREMTRGHIQFLRYTRGVSVARIGTFLMLLRDLARAPYFGVVILANGLRLSAAARPWWARLKFVTAALFDPPRGQDVTLPDPEGVRQ